MLFLVLHIMCAIYSNHVLYILYPHTPMFFNICILQVHVCSVYSIEDVVSIVMYMYVCQDDLSSR